MMQISSPFFPEEREREREDDLVSHKFGLFTIFLFFPQRAPSLTSFFFLLLRFEAGSPSLPSDLLMNCFLKSLLLLEWRESMHYSKEEFPISSQSQRACSQWKWVHK